MKEDWGLRFTTEGCNGVEGERRVLYLDLGVAISSVRV